MGRLHQGLGNFSPVKIHLNFITSIEGHTKILDTYIGLASNTMEGTASLSGNVRWWS